MARGHHVSATPAAAQLAAAMTPLAREHVGSARPLVLPTQLTGASSTRIPRLKAPPAALQGIGVEMGAVPARRQCCRGTDSAGSAAPNTGAAHLAPQTSTERAAKTPARSIRRAC